ncbi:hypothetical protein [Virgibacillus sp. 6R]|uniref:hypothetical protein n=1 Tax=Metabacillus niabensis TaxID=324854 RepID=UPI001642839D
MLFSLFLAISGLLFYQLIIPQSLVKKESEINNIPKIKVPNSTYSNGVKHNA